MNFKKSFNISLIILFSLSSGSVLATQTFSDTSNQLYEKPPANTTIINTGRPAAPTANPNNPTSTAAKKPEPIPHYTIEITSPTNEQTFQSNTISIPVSVMVTPELKKGDQVVLFIDGMQFSEPGDSTTFNTHRLDRGQHTLQAKVIQKNGPGAESPLVTIFQHRSSALLRPAAIQPLIPFGVVQA